MVSLLRRPFGFAFIYALVAALVSYATMKVQLGEYALLAVNYGALVVFTIVYILLVAAHLSHHFRLRASIYIPLISLVFGLVVFAINNPIMLLGFIKDINTWINIVLTFVFSYILITIGNWLAGFALKTKGHI